MRTTLDINRELLTQAKELGGFPTYKATVKAAIQSLVDDERRRKSVRSEAERAPLTLKLRDR